MLTVKVFDFDNPESWQKVQAVINDPLAVRALSAGMKARCFGLEEQWTFELGPWQMADRKNPNWPALEALSPERDDPNWYRIYGHAEAIAPWCAAVGQLVYPDHQWLVWYNRHRILERRSEDLYSAPMDLASEWLKPDPRLRAEREAKTKAAWLMVVNEPVNERLVWYIRTL